MLGLLMLLFLFGLSSQALAVPHQLAQQGRLLDSAGAAVDGQHVISFRIYDSVINGSLLWEEAIVTLFNNGYYSAMLGTDVLNNPLDGSLFEQSSLFLEVEFGNSGPMSPRKQIVSSPFAVQSKTAENLDGGQVNATDVQINGMTVIDGSGAWVGPASTVSWADLANVPGDIADGDDDSLAGITCSTGQILSWNGTQWTCAADNGLTESEVEAFVTNAPIDLAGGSLVGGDQIVTASTDQDSLGGLNCQNGDVAKWDSVLSSWVCDIDNDTSDWNGMSNIPSGFADNIDDNTQLTEAEVEQYIANGGIDLDSSTTIGGQSVMTHASCNNGEFLTYNNGVWDCSNLTNILDSDGDGSLAWDDCDDTDATIGSSTNDKDCDGFSVSIDCDDFDPTSETTLTDGDCDGVLTAEDCNDANPNLLALATDQDCDGYVVGDDCNDTDPFSTFLIQDADCDGVLTAMDCDDFDNMIGSSANDADCDGSQAADDCNDTDPSVSDCLFEFTSHAFTSCGLTGREGPSRSQCRSSYTLSDPWDENAAFYDMAVQGIQEWTVPETATYTIVAQGAAGADSENRGRNYGTSMQGDFSLNKGDVLYILVGQAGLGHYVGNHANEQGGGGGSFVVSSTNTPLLIAGGGGGTAGTSGGCTQTPGHANTGEDGSNVSCSYYASGGTGGNGGSTAGSYQGAAGGGFYTDGANGGSHCNTHYGGGSYLSGGVGGYGVGCYSPAHGGFGGGGAGGLGSPGGGGGFSGGASVGDWSSHTNHGGGGGSYNSGSNQVNTVMSGSTGYGPTNHDGVVLITKQ